MGTSLIKTPAPLGSPYGHRHSTSVGSYGGGVSHERGTPVVVWWVPPHRPRLPFRRGSTTRPLSGLDCRKRAIFAGLDCLQRATFAGLDYLKRAIFADLDCLERAIFAGLDCLRCAIFVGLDCLKRVIFAGRDSLKCAIFARQRVMVGWVVPRHRPRLLFRRGSTMRPLRPATPTELRTTNEKKNTPQLGHLCSNLHCKSLERKLRVPGLTH